MLAHYSNPEPHAHSMTKHSGNLSSILEGDLGIDPEYRHASKRATPGNARNIWSCVKVVCSLP